MIAINAASGKGGSLGCDAALADLKALEDLLGGEAKK
jgi:hypothetical protein